MVFNVDFGTRVSDFKHRKRNDDLWAGDVPHFNSDFCKRLDDF